MYRTETRQRNDQRLDPDRQKWGEDDDRRQGDIVRSGSSSSMQQRDDWGQRPSKGTWTGYMIPYRYYGPGYMGVGYYSVLYQGPGGAQDEDNLGEFDQREVDYGQGQGAGAAWTGRQGTQQPSRTGRGYAGLGPKGYQRSDQRIQEEISDRLMADDRIDASDIEVQVTDGEVTLSGRVDDRAAKRRAEDLAESVMGVRDVMNQVRVTTAQGSPKGSSPRSSSKTSRSPSTGSRASRNGGRSADRPTSAATNSQPRTPRASS
ncbi:MAG TPA: BON domain-containing protein [Candidatus Limnocylindrales bacterium]|nr:BON domain-containing protein [Candidatus Limnocylindrales bacterium]